MGLATQNNRLHAELYRATVVGGAQGEIFPGGQIGLLDTRAKLTVSCDKPRDLEGCGSGLVLSFQICVVCAKDKPAEEFTRGEKVYRLCRSCREKANQGQRDRSAAKRARAASAQ